MGARTVIRERRTAPPALAAATRPQRRLRRLAAHIDSRAGSDSGTAGAFSARLAPRGAAATASPETAGMAAGVVGFRSPLTPIGFGAEIESGVSFAADSPCWESPAVNEGTTRHRWHRCFESTFDNCRIILIFTMRWCIRSTRWAAPGDGSDRGRIRAVLSADHPWGHAERLAAGGWQPVQAVPIIYSRRPLFSPTETPPPVRPSSPD